MTANTTVSQSIAVADPEIPENVIKPNADGSINITGSIASVSSAVATAAAPSYSEGVAEPFSQDLSGNLRVAGTINANSSAHATAAAPTYVEGTDDPFSVNLTGDLRSISKQSGTWTVGISASQTIAVTNVGTFATQSAQSGTWTVGISAAQTIAVTNTGTFAVQAAEADGANVTLGAKADARSTATDTTPITAMSVLKQISASVQAPPSQAVTNAGTFAVQSAQSGTWTVGISAAQTIAVTNAGTFAVQSGEAVAQASTTSGQLVVPSGGRTLAATPTDTTAKTNMPVLDISGAVSVLPYGLGDSCISGMTTSMTGTTSTALTGMGTPGSGLYNYITQITVSNSHASQGTNVEIQDGNGGTTFYTIPAVFQWGGACLTFPKPLKQPTINTALYAKNTTTGAAVIVSASGFKGP